MIGGVRLWLLSILSASILCALAEALMPPGAVKQVGKLVCGLVLLCAVLSPAVGLDLEGGQQWLEDYNAEVEERTMELKRQVQEETKVIIEREYAAYIVDKAAELGLTCTAQVTCRLGEEGLYLPDWAEVSGILTQEERERIGRLIQEDLDIPPERQTYHSGEVEP